MKKFNKKMTEQQLKKAGTVKIIVEIFFLEPFKEKIGEFNHY